MGIGIAPFLSLADSFINMGQAAGVNRRNEDRLREGIRRLDPYADPARSSQAYLQNLLGPGWAAGADAEGRYTFRPGKTTYKDGVPTFTPSGGEVGLREALYGDIDTDFLKTFDETIGDRKMFDFQALDPSKYTIDTETMRQIGSDMARDFESRARGVETGGVSFDTLANQTGARNLLANAEKRATDFSALRAAQLAGLGEGNEAAARLSNAQAIANQGFNLESADAALAGLEDTRGIAARRAGAQIEGDIAGLREQQARWLSDIEAGQAGLLGQLGQFSATDATQRALAAADIAKFGRGTQAELESNIASLMNNQNLLQSEIEKFNQTGRMASDTGLSQLAGVRSGLQSAGSQMDADLIANISALLSGQQGLNMGANRDIASLLAGFSEVMPLFSGGSDMASLMMQQQQLDAMKPKGSFGMSVGPFSFST